MPIVRLSRAVIALAALGLASPVFADATIVELTQTGCQFLEAENGVDLGLKTNRKEDCEAHNAATGADRLAKAKVLTLAPGKYIFRVTNKNVPYGLGFYLRGDGAINRVKLPKVSGGGLAKGVTKDYPIDLKPGEYVYSCPLNPTPDYKIIVSG